MAEKRKLSTEEKKFFDQLTQPSIFMQKVHQKLETLSDIEKGIRTFEEKAKYISRPSMMKIEDWNNRVEKIKFFNISNKMIKMNYTRPFTKSLTISTEDEFIKKLEKDFDGFGTDATSFAKKGFKRSLYDSQHHIFIDYDQKNEFRDDRPVAIQLAIRDILGGHYDAYKNLIHLRFQTTFTAPNPENIFDILVLRKIWVFNKVGKKVFFEVWEEDADLSGAFTNTVESREYGFDFIPLKSFYPDDTNLPFDPDLIFADLADKNIEFFESAAEQRDYLSQGRIPILFITGLEENTEGIQIGKSLAIVASDPQASMKYIEINGQSLAAGEKYNQNLIIEMSQLGLELLNKKTNVTAAASLIDNAQNLSLLTAYAIAYEKFLKDVIETMVKMKRDSRTIKIDDEVPKFILSIDTDFSTVIDQAELNFLQILRATGDISGETLTNYAKDKGMLPAEFDYEEDQEKILSQGYSTNVNNTELLIDNKLKGNNNSNIEEDIIE